MATVNYMVTNILLNIFFCVQQKKEIHQQKKEMMKAFSFLGELSL